jgi:hypothetical protein
MDALPLKSEYRPTLGELLAPHWRRAPRAARALVLLVLVVCAAAAAAAIATLLPPTLSHGAPAPFSFSYRGLYRARPDGDGYAKVQRLQDGRLQDSFAVAPLLLAPYSGEPDAALALYATSYIRRVAARYSDFALRGEGWTQVDSISPYAVYNVFFSTRLQGRPMYGRDVLLLPQRPGARRGVAVSMLTAVAADKQVSSPLLVGTKGALEGPLVSFALG